MAPLPGRPSSSTTTGSTTLPLGRIRRGSEMRSFFFFSSRRRHTRLQGDWSSDVCSSDLMLEEQVIPRLLAKSGKQTAIYLKRFHSYGIGESHADALLSGVEALAPDGSVKQIGRASCRERV